MNFKILEMGECNSVTSSEQIRDSSGILSEESLIHMEGTEENTPWGDNNFFSIDNRKPKLIMDLHTTFSSINIRKEILLKEIKESNFGSCVEQSKLDQLIIVSKQRQSNFISEIAQSSLVANQRLISTIVPNNASRSANDMSSPVNLSQYLDKDYKTEVSSINKSSKLVRLKVRGKYPCMAGSIIHCEIL